MGKGTATYWLAAALLMALVSAGCSEVEIVRPGITQVYYQAPPSEVDILLVIDDSCSMEDEQEELSEGFDRFVEFFELAQVDYHIGVTTTDMENVAGSLIGYGGYRVIDADTPSPSEVFQANVQVGIEGSGFERGLDAAVAAVSPELLEGPNQGFLRDDAVLSLIFVSDEEDISHQGVGSYIDHFISLKDENARRDVFNASALIGLDPETGLPGNCGSPDDPDDGAVGSLRYFEVARQTLGQVGSICEDDFSDVVSGMGLTISRLLDSFLLDRRPRLGTIELTLFIPDTAAFFEAGTPVPPEGTADGQWAWEYLENPEEEEYLIQFVDPYSLPPLDSQILVKYDLF